MAVVDVLEDDGLLVNRAKLRKRKSWPRHIHIDLQIEPLNRVEGDSRWVYLGVSAIEEGVDQLHDLGHDSAQSVSLHGAVAVC